MANRAIRNFVLIPGLAVALLAGSAVPAKMFAQTQGTLLAGSAVPAKMFAQTQGTPGPEKSRTRRVTNSEQAAPSPTPPAPKEESPQESDEVVRVETNLTSIFFTAADSNKRFIDSLKKYSRFNRISIYLSR